MKLLIITQKVDKNDDVLGFFYDWIMEFARQCEKVVVICLEKGEYEFPTNVEVLSLGKEILKNSNGKIKIWRRIAYLFKFYSFIWKYRNEYDSVFVHMVPMYANIGAIVWKMLGKKILLWYAHGHVSLSLRMADKLVDTIYTSTVEGCRINSSKVRIIGQGIDTEKFNIDSNKYSEITNFFNIISVGRIAPIKDYETLIRAMDILVREHKLRNIRLKIIGGALLDTHEHYFRKLKKLTSELNLEKFLEFTGAVPYKNIVQQLQSANLMLSASQTGSLDKVILEAMSCGVPVITCNEAAKEPMGKHDDKLFFPLGNEKVLAEKILYILEMEDDDYRQLGNDLRINVMRNHGLKDLVRKIISKSL